MVARARRNNESYCSYKEHLKEESEALDWRLSGVVFYSPWKNVDRMGKFIPYKRTTPKLHHGQGRGRSSMK